MEAQLRTAEIDGKCIMHFLVGGGFFGLEKHLPRV